MRIDILTLFPDTVNSVLHESILGRAAKKGIIEINCVQIRDYSDNKQNQVDDYPYGGGFGCVMNAQPLKACVDSVMSTAKGLRSRVIFLSPQGRTYTQETAKRLRRDYDHLVLVCGHYEGVDERFIEVCVDEELSLGDFVLTGGEIAAMAVADSVCRLVPGVLADEQCYTGESHWDGLLEYPQYTRPELWEGRQVPQALIDGDHEKVERWRLRRQYERTMERRPDMMEKLRQSGRADEKLIAQIERSAGRARITHEPQLRLAESADIPAILEITEYARRTLRAHGVDQWQGEYPNEAAFSADIGRSECFVLAYEGETAAFFTLSQRPEDCYGRITDGKWSSDAPYCTLHRAAVAERFRGSGMAQCLIRAAEGQARSFGVRFLRVDTHKGNKAMQQLLRDNGYRYRGNVLVASEPGHDGARQAFEKILKDKK